MNELNINPNFKEIITSYGIDINNITVDKDGSLNCSEHGNWTYSSSKDVAYQTNGNLESSWILNNGKHKLELTKNYNTSLDKKFLKDITPNLVKELNSFLNEDIKSIWLDVGSSIYDLHLEIGISKDKSSSALEYTDFYFDISKDKKTLVPYFNGTGDLSEVVSKDTVEKLIIAIEKVQNAQELENKSLVKKTSLKKKKIEKDDLER